MEIALVILGLLLSIAGLIGSVFPAVPGPPLSFLALLVLSYAKNWEPFGPTFLIVTACITVGVVVLDYAVSALGAQKYGASKYGIGGSVLGMFIGIFFFPPFGMILGAIGGALIGELLAGKAAHEALKAGWGVFIGNLMGTGIKLAFCGAALFFYVKELL